MQELLEQRAIAPGDGDARERQEPIGHCRRLQMLAEVLRQGRALEPLGFDASERKPGPLVSKSGRQRLEPGPIEGVETGSDHRFHDLPDAGQRGELAHQWLQLVRAFCQSGSSQKLEVRTGAVVTPQAVVRALHRGDEPV
ncbi:MAG: hypothetical protein M3020_04530 [Myxococcota bacterium]|nr:hypothetical protein [Myxococcota bacterium]